VGRRLAIAPGEAHIWSADLRELGEGWTVPLAPAERRRAERILDRRAAARWAKARGVLRILLGAYLHAAPAGLEFVSGEHGKPRLAAAGEPSFNVSHSGPLAVFAVTAQGEVGVDIQLPRPGIDELALAERAFGTESAERLRLLDPPLRRRAFLQAWSAFEAALKWRGCGIGVPAALPDPAPWILQLELDDAAIAIALDRQPARLLARAVGDGAPARSEVHSSCILAAFPETRLPSARRGTGTL
jgi:4'-phosphopantetheinyl transferase